jgi:hypothetical protein
MLPIEDHWGRVMIWRENIRDKTVEKSRQTHRSFLFGRLGDALLDLSCALTYGDENPQ